MSGKTLLLALAFQLLMAGNAGAVVVTAVGDVMLGGSARRTLVKKGHSHAFAGTAAILRQGDISVGNLEAPVTSRGKRAEAKRFCFRTATSATAALQRAGFDVMTLANNHIMDYGEEGLVDTLRHLRDRNVAFTGAGSTLEDARRETVIRRGNESVAFLAYSLTRPVEFFAGKEKAGTAPAFAPFFVRDIARAKKNADHVVVSFHWGEEGATTPQSRQVATARAAIDAGASAVIGHHPHVLQGIEFYRGAPILYSLGNFAFGSMSRTARTGMIARIVLNASAPAAVELVPINVLNAEVNFSPVPLAGKKGERAIGEIRNLSLPLGTRIVRGEKGYLALPGEEAR